MSSVCKCGLPLKLLKGSNGIVAFEYYAKYCGQKQCHPRYGIKRPNHSKIMKDLVASGRSAAFNNTLMKRGEIFNKNVNTIQFKRKKLENKGVDVTGLSDLEIDKLNSVHESIKQHDQHTCAKMIMRFIHKHDLHKEFNYIDYETLVNMHPDRFAEIRRKKFSYHHAFYCANKCGAKHFKRILKDSLQCNLRELTSVITRSSYESNYIDFFEDNKIPWDYEPFIINLDSCTYKPDFIFTHENKTYILEVKGFLLEANIKDYLNVKINGGYDYARSNEYAGMIFTYDSRPKSIHHLINQTMKERF